MNFLLLSILMIILSIPNLICGNSHAFDLESDLPDTVDQGRKFDDFSAEKSQFDSFELSNNCGDIDVRVDGSVFDGKSSLKLPRLSFSSNLD